MSVIAQVCGGAVTPESPRLFSEAACALFLLISGGDQINSSETETCELRHILNSEHEGDAAVQRADTRLYFQFALKCDSSVPVRRPVSRSTYWKSSNTLKQQPAQDSAAISCCLSESFSTVC